MLSRFISIFTSKKSNRERILTAEFSENPTSQYYPSVTVKIFRVDRKNYEHCQRLTSHDIQTDWSFVEQMDPFFPTRRSCVS